MRKFSGWVLGALLLVTTCARTAAPAAPLPLPEVTFQCAPAEECSLARIGAEIRAKAPIVLQSLSVEPADEQSLPVFYRRLIQRKDFLRRLPKLPDAIVRERRHAPEAEASPPDNLNSGLPINPNDVTPAVIGVQTLPQYQYGVLLLPGSTCKIDDSEICVPVHAMTDSAFHGVISYSIPTPAQIATRTLIVEKDVTRSAASYDEVTKAAARATLLYYLGMAANWGGMFSSTSESSTPSFSLQLPLTLPVQPRAGQPAVAELTRREQLPVEWYRDGARVLREADGSAGLLRGATREHWKSVTPDFFALVSTTDSYAEIQLDTLSAAYAKKISGTHPVIVPKTMKSNILIAHCEGANDRDEKCFTCPIP